LQTSVALQLLEAMCCCGQLVVLLLLRRLYFLDHQK
jgi:hypothetical protein